VLNTNTEWFWVYCNHILQLKSKRHIHLQFICNIIKCLTLIQNGFGFIAIIYCNWKARGIFLAWVWWNLSMFYKASFTDRYTISITTNILILSILAVNVTGGNIILFDRKMLRNFRNYGHNWKKKKDGKTVKEAHEHLKVGLSQFLICF
jgi:hypothetical protein